MMIGRVGRCLRSKVGYRRVCVLGRGRLCLVFGRFCACRRVVRVFCLVLNDGPLFGRQILSGCLGIGAIGRLTNLLKCNVGAFRGLFERGFSRSPCG